MLTISGLLGVSLFGVLAMQHNGEHGHEGCIATAINGQPCPQDENTLAFAVFHIAASKDFSTAIFKDSIFTSLVALVLLIAGVCFGTLFITVLAPWFSFAYFQHQQECKSSALPYPFTYWLALHENSPTFFCRMPM